MADRPKDDTTGKRSDLSDWEDRRLLVYVAELVTATSRHFGRMLAHIERMEKHIMAADDQLVTDFNQMASDLDELATAIVSLQGQIQASNQQGALDEANKLLAVVQPMADKMRAAASQFDQPTPPAPTPDQSSRAQGGKSK